MVQTVQSSLLRVLRDLPNENRDVLKDISVTPFREPSQVALRLVKDDDVINRCLPLTSEQCTLAEIEKQALIIFCPYSPKSGATKIRVFYIDDKDVEHALDSDQTLQSLISANRSTEEKLAGLTLRVEFVVDDSDKKDYMGEKSEELTDIDCSVCGETGARELFFKCLHCNFSYICCNCQLITNQHENHFIVPISFLTTEKNDGPEQEICEEMV